MTLSHLQERRKKRRHRKATFLISLVADKRNQEGPAYWFSLLRECLARRTKQQSDNWGKFATQSMLGGALLGQKKYAEAEPLLLADYAGLKQRAAQIPATAKVRRFEAAERVVQLYEAWGRPEQAKQWRKKLDQEKGTN